MILSSKPPFYACEPVRQAELRPASGHRRCELLLLTSVGLTFQCEFLALSEGSDHCLVGQQRPSLVYHCQPRRWNWNKTRGQDLVYIFQKTEDESIRAAVAFADAVRRK